MASHLHVWQQTEVYRRRRILADTDSVFGHSQDWEYSLLVDVESFDALYTCLTIVAYIASQSVDFLCLVHGCTAVSFFAACLCPPDCILPHTDFHDTPRCDCSMHA